MVNATAKPAYGARLLRAMASTDPPVTVRGLAKDLRPDGVESMRRLLRRFLNGDRTPGPQVEGEILAALRERGADTAELESDDEEDADQMYRDLMDLCGQLEQIGQRLADRIPRRSVA